VEVGKSGKPTAGQRWKLVQRRNERILHPDFDHPPPIGPHWDWNSRGLKQGYRWFLDGRMELKKIWDIFELIKLQDETMLEYVLTYVGVAGAEYMLRSWGPLPGLCALLAPQIDKADRIYGMVPPGTSRERGEELRFGGLFPLNEMRSYLAARTVETTYAERGVLVVQDLWGSPEINIEDPRDCDWWAKDGEAYFWSEYGPGREVAVLNCLQSPASFLYAGFLIPGADVADAIRRKAIPLEQLAARTVEVYMPAYDWESFVIWTRPKAG
jgi:hypothetical protein